MTFSQLRNSPHCDGRHFFSLGDWKYVPCLQAKLPKLIQLWEFFGIKVLTQESTALE